MLTGTDLSYSPKRMRAARIRLLCAFITSIIGEVISIWHYRRLHWVCATVVFIIVLWQFIEDARHDKTGVPLFSAPAAAALAILYGICTAQVFFPQVAAHSMHEMSEMTAPAEHSHSPAHLLCLSAVFFLIARYFEKSACFSSAETLAELYEVAGDDIQAVQGGCISVPRGGVVPVDGTLMSGETSVDESILTGDVLRVTKREGDIIYCGSVNYDRAIEIMALYPREESVYPRLLAAIKRGASGIRFGLRHKTELIAKLLAALVGVVLLITVGFSAGRSHDAHMTVMYIITAAIASAPGALVMLSPLADVTGFALLGKSGIIVTNTAAAEAIALSRNVIFDKTALVSDDDGAEREGKAVTERTLREMEYGVNTPAANSITAFFHRCLPEKPGDSKDVRVAIGQAREMNLTGAGLHITQDRITHLLKAIYVCRILQRNVRLGLVAAAVYHAAVIALIILGFLTPVYAGIASAACSIGLIINNRRIERRCRVITFNKLHKL